MQQTQTAGIQVTTPVMINLGDSQYWFHKGDDGSDSWSDEIGKMFSLGMGGRVKDKGSKAKKEAVKAQQAERVKDFSPEARALIDPAYQHTVYGNINPGWMNNILII